MSPIEPFLQRTRVAYFSMEIAIRPEMHTYAGGLGILAGDAARSAADLDLPMVFVTLMSREGYLRQDIDALGAQIEHPDPWQPELWAKPLDTMIAVTIEGRSVWIRPWLYVLTCQLGNRIPILLLDTDLEHNGSDDRAITGRLYGGDERYRLAQEIVLGVGGERVLHALGFSVETYHLNEGHAALLPVALLRKHRRLTTRALETAPRYDADRVRQQCVFTTHTPIEAGHDRFDYSDVMRLLGDFIEADELRWLGGEACLNMTQLALNLTGFVNGVAERHAETTRRQFPGYAIRAITNGVHLPTWVHPSFARLFDAAVPSWVHSPEALVDADRLSDAQVWNAHLDAKADLVEAVRQRSGVELNTEMPVLAFARRMTGYKRPDLLFTNPARLLEIFERHPFQIVVAGKAHPQDEPGKAILQQIHRQIGGLATRIPAAFVPNYDMSLAKILVSGADLWLNTPIPPMEASGTSGMKAAANGVLSLSAVDGWWAEALCEGVNGWAIDEAADGGVAEGLYRKLDQVVLPTYFEHRQLWIAMMKNAIGKIAPRFNSHRMMRRYASEAYLR